MKKLQSHEDRAVGSTKDIYAICSLFSLSGNLKYVRYCHLIFMATFKSYILVESELDACERQ